MQPHMQEMAATDASRRDSKSPSGKDVKPQDVVLLTDCLLPMLAAGAHATWIYSKYLNMVDKNVIDGSNGVLPIPYWEPFVMSALYLLFHMPPFGFLWLYSEGIPPARCRAAMVVHNVYLTLLSLLMAVVFARETVYYTVPWARGPAAWFTSETVNAVFGQRIDASPRGAVLAWCLWVNYNSKFVEFLDTTFMLLRKNYRQASFLHLQHHAIMGPIMWLIIDRAPGGTSAFGPMLNSIVHTVMYAYYACLAMQIKWPLPKSLVTSLQMVQFFIVGAHGVWHYYRPDDVWPLLLTQVELALIVDMIVLFSHFFYQSYIAVDKTKTTTPKSKTRLD